MQEVPKKIRNSGAMVLAVDLGAPKQEKWINKYNNQLSKSRMLLAIGTTVDFKAGYKLRSPKWISEAGLK